MSESESIDRGEVAAVEVLRRLQWLAIGLAVVLGLIFGWYRGPKAWLALTLAAAVCIVSLRSLEAAVRRLRVETDGSSRAGFRFSARWLVLLVVLVTALIVVSRDALAILIGLSVLPIASILEAGLQVRKLFGGSVGTEIPAEVLDADE